MRFAQLIRLVWSLKESGLAFHRVPKCFSFAYPRNTILFLILDGMSSFVLQEKNHASMLKIPAGGDLLHCLMNAGCFQENQAPSLFGGLSWFDEFRGLMSSEGWDDEPTA